ncbi:MAG: hypothetical protein HY924_11770 [Elusimicrobia bacterium]|nr:hypothetical protein [Elusimicrobiota bacterium]
MKLSLALLSSLFLCSCNRQAVVRPPAPEPPKAVAEVNFELTAVEVVESAEEDAVGLVKVFVDNELAGQTQAGPRSSERRWLGALAPGNRLLRLEQWAAGPTGDPQLLPEELQPRERFVRVEEGFRTRVLVRFTDGGRKSTIQVSRDPLR